jgi:uncharacterized protein (DUF169 family)
MNTDRSEELLRAIATVRRMCPDMRFGQMLAALDLLSEDMTDRNFWDIEDDELLVVVERFRQDLARRDEASRSYNT